MIEIEKGSANIYKDLGAIRGGTPPLNRALNSGVT